MNIRQFIEKHIETNYPDENDKQKTIIRTAVHLGYEFAKSNEPMTSEIPQVYVEKLKPYLHHLSNCGIEHRDELRAMRKVPEKYRNETYYQDLRDIESSPMVCTCGLDNLTNTPSL